MGGGGGRYVPSLNFKTHFFLHIEKRKPCPCGYFTIRYFFISVSLFKYIFFCFILLFTSSLPCRKDQFAILYFSTSLIVLIQVYNWEIWYHSLVCCCGFADILNILINPLSP